MGVLSSQGQANSVATNRGYQLKAVDHEEVLEPTVGRGMQRNLVLYDDQGHILKVLPAREHWTGQHESARAKRYRCKRCPR